MILNIAMHPTNPLALRDFLNFAVEQKVDGVDLRLDCMELLSAFDNKQKIKEIKQLLNQYDLKIFAHAPIIDLCLPSFNPILHQASLKAMIKAVTFACEIEAEVLVSHVGRLSKDYSANLIEKATCNSIKNLKIINSKSLDLGLPFTIENDCNADDHILAGQIDQIQSILETVSCKMTLDVGHANTLGDPLEFYRTFREHIVYMHVHDNNGSKDEHLPVGQGNIKFSELFKLLQPRIEKLPVTIECHSKVNLAQSVNVLKSEFSF